MNDLKTTIEMPTTAAQITAVWLTEALRSSETIGMETAVSTVSAKIMSGAGYVGQVVRLTLGYDTLSTDAPTTLVAKFSHPDPDTREALHHLYLREVHVYQELIDNIDLATPRCYYSDVDPESGHAILLLEDLAHLRTGDIAKGCTLEDAETVVTHFARHHAQWWEHPLIYADDFLKAETGYDPEWIEAYQGWWSQYAENLTTAFPGLFLPATFLALGEQVAQQLQEIRDQAAATPFTLIHRDTHLDNLMFAGSENDPLLTVIDWQLCNGGVGVSDIAYFMIFSMPVELRRQSERRLIQSYHATLLAHGVVNYSFEQCWRDYRLAFFRNLAVCVCAVSLLDLTGSHAQSFFPAATTRLVSFAQDHAVHEFLLGDERHKETAVSAHLKQETLVLA